MPRLIFDVSLDRLTWDDLIFLQEGGKSYRYMKDLAAKFMVDDNDNGAPVEPAAAHRILSALAESEVKKVIADVIAGIVEARKNAVNPTSAG